MTTLPLYECRDCGALARGSSDIAPGPPDFCAECNVGNDRPLAGNGWREIDPATVAESEQEKA